MLLLITFRVCNNLLLKSVNFFEYFKICACLASIKLIDSYWIICYSINIVRKLVLLSSVFIAKLKQKIFGRSGAKSQPET